MINEVFIKRIADSLVMFPLGRGEPILIPNADSPEIMTGSEAYEKLSELRLLIKARYVITGCCNQRCYHCYASEDFNRIGLPTKDAMKVIDEIANAGTLFLQFDGGEVGCRKDFPDLVNYATSRGLLIEFFTNGTLFDDRFFKKTNFDNIISVIISIHSDIGSIHDRLTNLPGSFEKAVRNIVRFRDKVKKTMIKMTITKKNLEFLPGMYGLSERLGVDFAYSTRLFQQSVTPQDSLELEEKDMILMRKICPDVFSRIPKKRICIGGRNSCYIDPDGNLFPCRLVDIKLGNVLKESLIDLWNSDLAKTVSRRVFAPLDQCNSCNELKEFCFCCRGMLFRRGVNKVSEVQYCRLIAKRTRALYHDD